MAQPVTGSELKVRGYEAPRKTKIGADHVVNLDGPLAGPASIAPADLVSDSIRSMQSVDPAVAAAAGVLVPVTYPSGSTYISGKAPLTGLTGTQFYLGPKQFPPLADNNGGALVTGMTYYNINDDRIYVWASSQRWVPGGSAYPASVRTYYYTFVVPGQTIPPNGPGTVDSYGNVLSFDISAGQAAINSINVYVNGVMLVSGIDYTVIEGGVAGDYISLMTELCANSVVIVQVFSTGETVFVPNAVQLNVVGWVFDGVQKTFPLLNMQGDPVNPASANNILLSFNGTILQPNADFTTDGVNLIFTTAPPPGSTVWGIVGIPVGGGAIRTVSPANFGGVGDKVADDTLAMTRAIQRMAATGATLDLSGGVWRITGPLPQFGPCNIEGLGSGEIYVDFDPEGDPIFDCYIQNRGIFDVTTVAEDTYDFGGVLTATSAVTRITLSLTPGQTMPVPGQIGKLVCDQQIVGVEAGDNIGEHVYIAAVDGNDLIIPNLLYDTYAGTIQLVLLDQRFGVTMKGLRFSSNWDTLVSDDWLFEYIRVTGAVRPHLNDISMRDGVQGITLAGTWMATTRGIYATHMRNATASENPPVPGYGVVDAGSFMSHHASLDGADCRHIYTTVSPDASGWDKVAWGRTIKPQIVGGNGYGCSAAAYDVHSDCVEPRLVSLNVYGGYFGENSAGAGIQLRGIRGRIINSIVRGCAVGFEIYKQFAGEEGNHAIENCWYFGDGTPIRAEHDPGLTGGDEIQTLTVRDFYGETTSILGIDLSDALLNILGEVMIVHTGTGTQPRAVFMRSASALGGPGKLTYDVSRADLPDPRVITFTGSGNGTLGRLQVKVIAGANDWQAVVSENDSTPPTGNFFAIDCDCDLAPNAASGGYSQNGAGTLLPAGALSLRLTVKGATRQAIKTGAFTLKAADYDQTFMCDGTFTITVPDVDVLGPEFRCKVLSLTGTITLDAGGADATVVAGSMAEVMVADAAIFAPVSTMNLIN